MQFVEKKMLKNLGKIIFEETTTIGIRKQKMEMTMLKTEIKNIDTPLGKVQIKLCDLKDEKRIYPEYNSIVKICKKLVNRIKKFISL